MSITGIAFLLIFAAGCLAAITRHPVFGIVTYVAVFYLHPPSRWWGEGLPELRWSLVAAVVTLFAAVIHRDKLNPAPLMGQRVMIGLLLFLAWIGVQSFWALEPGTHQELVVVYAKYLLLVGLIYKCIDSIEHLRLVLWTHVLGCVYLGTIVLEQYFGGRFEGFGGPDINEANSGALQVVTGLAAAAAIFLAGTKREKIALFIAIPLILNALVATLSRSGFLALVVTGIAYIFLAPRKYAGRVRVLSVLALLLFVLLTNPVYWTRIGSITQLGAEVEGVDTGSGRLVVVEAQWRMFGQYPLGCGHRCTATLSPDYLDDIHLDESGENRARSSHNTFMTMLVEQGVPGGILYIGLLVWTGRRILALRRSLVGEDGMLATAYTAIAASLVAVFIGDLFVDYLKLEVRIWFLGLLMVVMQLSAARVSGKTGVTANTAGSATRGSRRRSNHRRISAGGG